MFQNSDSAANFCSERKKPNRSYKNSEHTLHRTADKPERERNLSLDTNSGGSDRVNLGNLGLA